MKPKILLTIAIFCTCAPLINAAQANQNHDAIYAAARDYIQTNLGDQSEHEILLSSLDPRMQLHDCEKALEISLPNPPVRAGRNSIGVRCNSTQGWSLFLSATVKIFEEVAILNRDIKRGEIIQAAFLNIERKDISQLKTRYIKDINQIISQQASRNLAAGTVLNDRDYTKAILIKRGENVIIQSTKPFLNIQMQGIALSDGAAGQHISVKNTSSGRTITATVVQPGIVSVNY